MNLHRRIGTFLIERALRNQYFHASDHSKTDIIHAGILVNAENPRQQRATEDFANNIESRYGLQPHVFYFMNRKLDPSVTFQFPHFSLTDMRIGSLPKNKRLDLFLQRPYEVFLNLDLSNFAILHFISNQATSRHKLAISPRFPKLYDIIIEKGESRELAPVMEKTLDIFAKISLG